MSLHYFNAVFLGCRFDFLGTVVRASLQTRTLAAAHSVSRFVHLALASANPNCKVLILQFFPCLFPMANTVYLSL